MRTQSEAVTAVHGSLAALPAGRWVLAVSGGRDSMVLLDAMARARGHEIAAVATFNHGTGAAATRAVSFVERTALALELPVVVGEMPAAGERRGASRTDAPPTEAVWRDNRWHFLNAWADELQATVVTAHTLDDQIETVVIRMLRDAGARGLAGMLAPRSPVARPLLTVSRAMIAEYARAGGIAFIEDPSNSSMAHQRNRVRHELLPAFERAQPGFGEWCLRLSSEAAVWRQSVTDFIESTVVPTVMENGLVFRAAPLRDVAADGWAVLWPELAARASVTMDWRGIERASAWAPSAKSGSSIPLAGGARIERTLSTFVIARPAAHEPKEG